MDDVAAHIPIRQSPLQYALEMLQRGAALYCLALGIGYWLRLVGFFEGTQWRFDLMPLYWQATAAPLAVLFPFAAVGLWSLASWGPVIWFLCAATEIAMYGVFPDLFGGRPWLIALHGLVAASYAVLRVLLYVGQRKAAD